MKMQVEISRKYQEKLQIKCAVKLNVHSHY
jgi:hypothetical protein